MRRALVALALVALAPLAGCISATNASSAEERAEVATSAATLDGVLAEHTPIASFDGTMLDAWVFRPETDEPVPVIINFSPYWGNAAPPTHTGGDAFSLYLIDHFVPRGYAVALVSARGTGLSEGCFTIGGPTEIADEDVVATYLATQPWANGNVTATGKSYDGTMAQGLITTGNPHVKTIVPVSPISELYKYNYVNGVPYFVTGHAFNTYYVAMTSLAQRTDPNDPSYARTPTRFCDESVDVQAHQFGTFATGDYTSYWQARNYTAMLPDDLATSVFYIHGLQDWNVKPDHMDPWIEELRARGVPVKMWLGQWEHDYPHRDDFNRTLLRWLDHHLKGIDTGILDEPLVQVQDTDGVWRDEAEWPPARAARLALHTSAEGKLGATPGSGASTYRDAPASPVLTFRAQGLAEPLRLVGTPTLHVAVGATTPRATLSATLRLDGEPINHCFLDLAHRDGLASTQPMLPLATYEVSIPCYPMDVVAPLGGVLTLEIGHDARGDRLVSVAPIPTGGTVTVQHGERTYLSLATLAVDDAAVESPQPGDVGCWTC